MKIIASTIMILFLFGCASSQSYNGPKKQTFYSSSVDQIQSELISAYLSSDKNWSIKDQSRNSLVFTRVNNDFSGMFMQAMVSGSSGSLPIVETHFNFASSGNVTVFPRVSVINTNAFGRQQVTPIENVPEVMNLLTRIKNKLEP